MRARRGASAVEFALWMPIMLLLFGGIIDLSMYMNQMHRVVRVSREAARHSASLNLSQLSDTSSTSAIDVGLQTACNDRALAIFTDLGQPCTSCSIACSWRTDTSAESTTMAIRPEIIEVVVSEPYVPMLNLLPFLSGQRTQTAFTMVTQVQVNTSVL